MADIKKSYPNAWMFVGKTNYKPYNLISEFSKEIKVFEKIYEPSYFEKLKNNYTIRPIEISESAPLADIKKNIEPGSMFSLNINSQVRKELSTIIIYIKSKGYNIDNLENHLLE